MKKIMLTLMIFLLSLTGCTGKTSMETQLSGTWYMEGGQEVAFVLYDDGTCEIAGEYGTGTWSVVNDDQFKLTNYYGESETATIEKIEKDILVLSDGNVRTIFSRYSDRKLKENINENEEESINEGNSKNYEDKYLLQSVINPSYHYVPFTIDSSEHFWVEAINMDNEEERRMLNIDLEGEIFFDVPFVGDTNISIVENKYICSNNTVIYNIEGTDITSSFCDNNEELVGVYQDTTGWSVWVYESIDTYDSHEFIVKVKDLDGTIKGKWSKTELSDKYEEVNLSQEIGFLGGSWYKSGNMIFNVENKVDICCRGVEHCGADNNYLYLCYSDGWLSLDSIVFYDSQGNDVTSSFTFLEDESFWFNRYLGEGMMLLENHDRFLIVDANGNIPFDVNQFSSRGTWGDDKSINEFNDGKAQVELINENGVMFTTLINNKGEFLFEPIKGTMGYANEKNMWKYQYGLNREAEDLSCLMDDAGNLIKDSGEVYIKEGDELTSYIVIENGKLVVYPVEKIE